MTHPLTIALLALILTPAPNPNPNPTPTPNPNPNPDPNQGIKTAVRASYPCGQGPTAEEATVIANEVTP